MHGLEDSVRNCTHARPFHNFVSMRRCSHCAQRRHRPLPLVCAQARPRIFDLEVQVPGVLYEAVVEVDEQVVLPLGSTPDRLGRSHGSRV